VALSRTSHGCLVALREKPEFRLGRIATILFFPGLFSEAAEFSFQQMTPQFGTASLYFVARFAALERRQRRACKLHPCHPQQFFQTADVAVEKFWLRHPQLAFEICEATL